jgi:membrane protein
MAVRRAAPRHAPVGWLRFTWRLFRDAWLHFDVDGGWLLAGHIAFASLLAFFPFLIVLTIVAGWLGETEMGQDAVDQLLAALPRQVEGALWPAVHQVTLSPPRGLFTASVLGALWAAASGLEALREGVNRAYGVGAPPAIWWRRLQSLGLTLAFAVALLMGTVAIVLAPLAWNAATLAVRLPDEFGAVFDAVRYGLGVIVMIMALSVLYRFLPNVTLRRREIYPGAVFAALAWLAAGSLFSIYVSYAPGISILYGSLAGAVVALLFFYISAIIFLFGAEINAVWRRRRAAAAQP